MIKHTGLLMRKRRVEGVLLAVLPVALFGLITHTAHWRPRTLNAGYKPITALEFSPDGRALAVAGWGGPKGEEVQVWDVPSGRLRQTLHAPRSIFTDVLAFSRDGKTLASGGTSIYLWNVPSGRLQRELRNAHGSAPLVAMAFSPDGRSLACGRLDHGIELWDAQSAILKRRLSVSAASPCRLDFSARDEVLIGLCGVSVQGFEIKRWNLQIGAAKSRSIGNPRDVSQHGSTVSVIAPDWKTLAVARGDEVRLWQVEAVAATKRRVLRLRRENVTALAMSADSATLAVAGYAGTITLWDARTGQASQTIQERQGIITALTFSPDDSLLAVGHRGGSVRLRRLK